MWHYLSSPSQFSWEPSLIDINVILARLLTCCTVTSITDCWLHLSPPQCVPIHLCYFSGRKMVDAPGGWFKGVVQSACNKPVRVLSPIPFRSQVHFHLGGLLLWWCIYQVVRRSVSLQRKWICSCTKWKRMIHNEHTCPYCSWTLPWPQTTSLRSCSLICCNFFFYCFLKRFIFLITALVSLKSFCSVME